MCGEVPIAEYLSMMSVPRHWDHLSHQNLVTFTRYRIQNLFIKSQHSFLNYSAWLVLSPSQAFTVGRAVPWCANLLMSHWWDFTEWKTWANSSDTKYQPCGSPKAIGKGHKQSSLTGENFKINLSLQIPASSFMAEMWKFTASWIQMGQHTSPNLESLQHCWNMNRLLFLLTLVISFSAANAPNAFHTYTFGATACVLEQGSQAHSPPGWWRSCQFVWLSPGFPAQPQGATTSVHMERRVHPARAMDGAGQRGRFSSTRWNIAFLVSGALYNRTSWIIHWWVFMCA